MKKLSLPRALVVFGAPLSFIIIGVIHPLELHVGDSAGLYIGIHIVQLFSIWGMALMLGIITEGIENRAARNPEASHGIGRSLRNHRRG